MLPICLGMVGYMMPLRNAYGGPGTHGLDSDVLFAFACQDLIDRAGSRQPCDLNLTKAFFAHLPANGHIISL